MNLCYSNKEGMNHTLEMVFVAVHIFKIKIPSLVITVSKLLLYYEENGTSEQMKVTLQEIGVERELLKTLKNRRRNGWDT